MKHPLVLAIDGPAGSGKTTSAREAARRLGFAYLDSGALYRAIAFAAVERGIDTEDASAVRALTEGLAIRPELSADRFHVFLGEEDLSEKIRDPIVTAVASKIAVYPSVRSAVVAWLRELADAGPAVVEGRDIGSVVFPDATLKVYLTARVSVRVDRRARELRRRGLPVDRGEVARGIVERDRRDAERRIAPLTRVDTAIEIDTTDLDPDDQVSRILDAWADRVPPRIRFGYRLHQILIRFFARLFWGLRIEGGESIPRVGGLILVSNHKSYLDPLLAGSAVPREIHYLAKRELFEIPILKYWVRANNAIPIDRDRFDRRAIERALGIVRRGAALLVFPEGTRIDHPGLGPPHEGVAWVAGRARVPILPLYIEGSWARRRRWFRPGGMVIRIGDPIFVPPVPPGREGREQLPEVAEKIMAAIRALSGRPESG